jgi:quercetin dioxygenase-like cupin family protein
MTTAAEHFASQATGERTADGRFVEVAAIDPVVLVEGLEFRPVLGERTMVNFVRFAPNTVAPRHVHLEEQIVIVLEGEFVFELDGTTRTMRPGDVAVVPPCVPHAAHTEDIGCYEVDVFNPPRETLLEHARTQRDAALALLAEIEDGTEEPLRMPAEGTVEGTVQGRGR